MFSSNQVLRISGEYSQLADALQFAMDYSEHSRHFNEEDRKRGCKMVYQITDDGKYCVGWAFKDVPEGWTEFQFDFQVDIVAKIIVQFLKKHEIKDSEFDYGDGSSYRGFIMKSFRDSEERMNIKNSFYGIVYFESFVTYYAK